MSSSPDWTCIPRTTHTWARQTSPARPRPTWHPRAARRLPKLRRRIDAGEWVVDLRSRTAFAAGHLRGALNFENGVNLATYLGWLIPWGISLTLIADSAQEVADAQRELCRIGIDRIEAAGYGSPAAWAEGKELRASRSPISLPWLPSLPGPMSLIEPTPARRCSSTCGVRPSGRQGTSPVPCTSRCTSCRPGWARSPAARSGFTARPATGQQ